MWFIQTQQTRFCCSGAARYLAPLLTTLLLFNQLSAFIPSINCDQLQQPEISATTQINPIITITDNTNQQLINTNQSAALSHFVEPTTQDSKLTSSETTTTTTQNPVPSTTTTTSTENPQTTTQTPSTTPTTTTQSTTTTTTNTPKLQNSSRFGVQDDEKFALIADQESVSPETMSFAIGQGEQSTQSSLLVASSSSSTSVPMTTTTMASGQHRQGRSSQSTPSNPGYSAPLTSRLSAYSPATMLAQGSRIGNIQSDTIHQQQQNNPFISNQQAITTTTTTSTTTTTTPAPKPVTDPIIVCYLGSWSVYRPGISKFTPENINPFLCTHVIYAFAGLSSKLELKPFDSYNDITQGGYRKFTSLKEHNKQLKTLIAVGGWNEGSSRFSRLVGSSELRANFVQSAIRFLREHKFDGLDLDWEYPAFRDGSSHSDKEKYALLIKELRIAFDKDKELHPSSSKLLLSVAVPAGQDNIDNGFDVATISDNVDFMNVLTYDYYTAFDKQANHHAPLTLRNDQVVDAASKRLTVDWTINYYLSLGANPAKLIVGVPTYGRSYTLTKSLPELSQDETRALAQTKPEAHEVAEKLGLGASAEGPGEEGSATREKGYLAYYEICQRIDQDSWTKEREFAAHAQGPIAFKANQWVSYDDLQSVIMKTQYVIKRGLGGVMVWTLDNDDFRASCKSSEGQESPLISAIRDTLIKTLTQVSTTPETQNNHPKPMITNQFSGRQFNSNKQHHNHHHHTTTTTTTTSTTTSTTTTTTPAPEQQASTESVVVITDSDANQLGSSNELAASSSDESSASSGLLRNLATGKAQSLIPTTPEPGAAFTCKDEGFFANPKDCKKYFWCLDSGPANLGVVAHAFTCPSGLVFNPQTDGCDYAEKVGCKSARKSTTTTTTTTTTSTTTTTPKPKQSFSSTNNDNSNVYQDKLQQQQAASSDRSRLVVVKKHNRKPSTTTTSTTTSTTTTTTTTTTTPPPQTTTSSDSNLPVTNDINELVASMLQNPQFAQVISDQLNRQQQQQQQQAVAATNNNNNANQNTNSDNNAMSNTFNSDSMATTTMPLNAAQDNESPFGNTDSLTANMSSKQAHELLQLLNLIQSLGGVDKIAPYLAQQLAIAKNNMQHDNLAGQNSPAMQLEDNALINSLMNEKLNSRPRSKPAIISDQAVDDLPGSNQNQFVFNYATQGQASESQQAPSLGPSSSSTTTEQSLSAEVMQNIAQLESLFAYNQPGRQLIGSTGLAADTQQNNKHFINPTSSQQFTLNDAKVLLQNPTSDSNNNFNLPPSPQIDSSAMIRVKVPDQHHHHHHHHHHHQNQNQNQKQATRAGNQHRTGITQQQQQQPIAPVQTSRSPPTKLADYNNLLPYLEGDVRQPIQQRLQQQQQQQQQQNNQIRRQPQANGSNRQQLASFSQSFAPNQIPAASSLFASDSIEALAEQAQVAPSGGSQQQQQQRQQSRNRPQSASVSQATLVRQQQQSQSNLQPQQQQQPRSRRPPNREHRTQRLNTQDFPLDSSKPMKQKKPKQQQQQQQQLQETTRSLVLLSEGPPSSIEGQQQQPTASTNQKDDISLLFNNPLLNNGDISLSELSDSLSDSALEERLRQLESGLFPPETSSIGSTNNEQPTSTSNTFALQTSTDLSQPALNSFTNLQTPLTTTAASSSTTSEPSTIGSLGANNLINPSTSASTSTSTSSVATTLAELFNSNGNYQDDSISSTQTTTTTGSDNSSQQQQQQQQQQTSSQQQLLPNSSFQEPGASYDLNSGLLVCNRRGVFAHPKSCGQFIVCAPQSRSQKSLRPFEHHCPAEHIFHDSWGRCRPKSLQSDLTKLCQASQL